MSETIVIVISIWLRIALCILALKIMRISKRRAFWLLIAGLYLLFAVVRVVQFTTALTHHAPIIDSEPLMLNVAGDFLLAASMLLLSLFSRDIRSAQKQLRENEEQLNNLFAHMKSGALILRPMAGGLDFLILNINQAGCDLDNISREAIQKKNLSTTKLIPSTLMPSLQRVARTGDAEYIPEAFCGSNDTPKWRDFYIYKLPDAGQVVVIYSDLTSKKMAAEQHNLLSTAIEQAYEAIIITDPEGQIEYTNTSFERMLGYRPDEILNHNISIIKSNKHKTAFYDELWATISNGETWQGKIINRKKNGKFCNHEVTISAIRAPHNDQITHYISVQRDISQEAELKSQLLQAQKMEAIGALAGGIAHDFNNILFALTGYADLSLRSVEKGTDMHQNLLQILQAGERATDLIKQILSFSRQEPQEKKPFAVQHIIRETTKLLARSLPPNIQVIEQVNTDCEMTQGDPTQIHQVLMNLCTNAYQAMRENGGTLTIRLEPTEVKESTHFGSYSISTGKYLELIIADSGHGMDAETQERIFDPYFSTKRASEGTGLGLTVAHSIIDSHGGRIFCESVPGKGTTFRILLPVIETEETAPSSTAPKALDHGDEHILLVDDDVAVLTICTKMLAHLGYKVAQFSEPDRALEAFSKNPHDFDLIISDQVMPSMFGIEMLQKMLVIRRDIPSLLMSGYTSESSIEQVCEELGISQFLPKPVDMETLSETVRKLLK